MAPQFSQAKSSKFDDSEKGVSKKDDENMCNNFRIEYAMSEKGEEQEGEEVEEEKENRANDSTSCFFMMPTQLNLGEGGREKVTEVLYAHTHNNIRIHTHKKHKRS